MTMAASTGNGNTTWMSKLPEPISNLPLYYLAIPGSHNSFSADLDRTQDVSIDEPGAIKFLGKIGGKGIICNWGKCQTLSIKEQLEAGIRYLDLRICRNPKSKQLTFLHGLYGRPVEELIANVQSFVEVFSKEVILIDVNHLYGCSADDVLRVFVSKMDEKLLSKDRLADSSQPPSLSNIWNSKYGTPRVTLFLNNHACGFDNLRIYSPWHNTDKHEALFQKLDTQKNNNNSFNVSQGVLTPQTKTILTNHSLKAFVDKTGINSRFMEWLKKKKSGRENGINICICDFIECNSYIDTVIGMNTEC
ncbi:hypothetical protein SNE40_014429 [Patella caerulea]|uniref:Phosphatidylinositol-specific phospholipase C X domain-containing protein n=1 Tax=Patella caerulea TaxID=87958 RepID=A0AAN8JHY7_PATCE